MKKAIKITYKVIGIVLLIPLLYLIISLVLTYIPVSEKTDGTPKNKIIYLTTNGVHSDIVFPKEYLSPEIQNGLYFRPGDSYFAMGWGEENFYLNTPTWGDLRFSVAFRAAFLKSNTLIHITRYKSPRKDWVAIPITDSQLHKLNTYILNSFAEGAMPKKRMDVKGYTENRDDFYHANGNYMFYRTCNSWVNTALKESNMKACLWTPFDFGAIRRHQSF